MPTRDYSTRDGDGVHLLTAIELMTPFAPGQPSKGVSVPISSYRPDFPATPPNGFEPGATR